MRLLRSASVHMARGDQKVEQRMAEEVFEVRRTAKEIKKALRISYNNDDTFCDDCRYAKKFFDTTQLELDAFEYIEELEKRVAVLKAKVPKWVSVKDRLPGEESMLCLVVSDGDLYVSHWHWSGGGAWFFTDGECDSNVTHWAKAPELPKEEYHDKLS